MVFRLDVSQEGAFEGRFMLAKSGKENDLGISHTVIPSLLEE